MAYADPDAQRAYQREWMRKRRADYLDGKSCVFCSRTENLEVHHFDPANKLDHKVWSWSSARREAELAKCVVLCHDCHAQRHREEKRLFCKRGHQLTPANTYKQPGRKGKRECRTCRALRRTGGARFELARRVEAPNALAGRPLRPLGHPPDETLSPNLFQAVPSLMREHLEPSKKDFGGVERPVPPPGGEA